MATVTYETGTHRFERRIGRRVDIEPLDVSWVDPPSGPGAAPRRVWPARVVNVSVTGAAIEGPSALPWAVGDKAVVRFQGSDSAVTVNWTAPTETPGVSTYGVEFAILHAALKQEVYRACGRGRPGEDRWERAV